MTKHKEQTISPPSPQGNPPPVEAPKPTEQFSKGVDNFLQRQASNGKDPEEKKVKAEPVVEEKEDDEEPTDPPPAEGEDEGDGAPAGLDLGFADDEPEPVVGEAKKEPAESKTQSIKYFKGQLSEKEKRIKDLETENASLKQRKTPEEVGDAIAELQDDPEYRKAYVETPQAIFDAVAKAAASYDVDPEALKQAIGHKDFKTLNTYLRSIGIEDDDARAYVRGGIQQIQQIHASRSQVDKKPFEFVEKIREKKRLEREQLESKIEDEYTDNYSLGWGKALEVFEKKRTSFPELVESDEDPAWNEKVVTPTREMADRLYRDSVKDLKLAGGRLIPSMAQRLATYSQSYASMGEKLKKITKLEKENNDLRSENQRLRGVARPGSSSSREGTQAPPKPEARAGNIIGATRDFLSQQSQRRS